MSVGEVSVGDFFSGKSQSGKCPVGKLSYNRRISLLSGTKGFSGTLLKFKTYLFINNEGFREFFTSSGQNGIKSYDLYQVYTFKTN